jgi:hypothetical protein
MKMHDERTLGSDIWNNTRAQVLYHVGVVKATPIKLNVMKGEEIKYFYITSLIFSGKRHVSFQALDEVSVRCENLLVEQPSQRFIILSGLRPQLSMQSHSQYCLYRLFFQEQFIH